MSNKHETPPKGIIREIYFTYTLTAKNMEYFLIQRLFAFLCAVQGISVLEIPAYEQILLLEELISTKQQNEAQRFKNNYFGIFLNQNMVRILFVPVSVCFHIHSCVVLRYCAQYHCLFTAYFGAVSRGLASWGPRIEGRRGKCWYTTRWCTQKTYPSQTTDLLT